MFGGNEAQKDVKKKVRSVACTWQGPTGGLRGLRLGEGGTVRKKNCAMTPAQIVARAAPVFHPIHNAHEKNAKKKTDREGVSSGACAWCVHAHVFSSGETDRGGAGLAL